TFGAQTLASAAVVLSVDQTAPDVSMLSDGRTTFLAAGQTASMLAQIVESGSGVDPASVCLVVVGETGACAHPGTARGANQYGFSVLIDDSIALAGTSIAVPFSIAASDLAGNSEVLVGSPLAVLTVDRDAPQFSALSILTAADYTDATPRDFYKEGATPLKVQATITDGAGVDPTSVCLRIAGESGACAHPGTAGSANQYGFDLPR